MTMRLFLSLATVALGCLSGCATTARHNLPPAQRLLEPGPGVGGPGPGVMGPEMAAMAGPGLGPGPGPGTAAMAMGGVVQAGYDGSCNQCGTGGGYGPGDGSMVGAGMLMTGLANIQVLFNSPDGMQIQYDTIGDGSFSSQPLYVPGRVEFPQGGIFRLKLTNISGLEGVELYPTLEVAAGNIRTAAYLAHNAIPIQFTVEDFNFALGGNFVTKVIYLPDPEFQGDALAGVGVMASNRLEPGLDPIVEADRRGSILAIIRLGNKDVEMAGATAGLPAAGGVVMGGMLGPDGCMMPGGVPTSLPGYVAGVTGPQYGMTYTGTPIGLPGPPHIPLGTPAGLQKHTIRNTTHMHLPDPVKHVHVNVRQIPGESYPTPPSHVRIREQNLHPGVPTGMPLYMRHSQDVGPGPNPGMGADGAYCPPQ
jgi:hypothetical protein